MRLMRFSALSDLVSVSSTFSSSFLPFLGAIGASSVFLPFLGVTSGLDSVLVSTTFTSSFADSASTASSFLPFLGAFGTSSVFLPFLGVTSGLDSALASSVLALPLPFTGAGLASADSSFSSLACSLAIFSSCLLLDSSSLNLLAVSFSPQTFRFLRAFSMGDSLTLSELVSDSWPDFSVTKALASFTSNPNFSASFSIILINSALLSIFELDNLFGLMCSLLAWSEQIRFQGFCCKKVISSMDSSYSRLSFIQQ